MAGRGLNQQDGIWVDLVDPDDDALTAALGDVEMHRTAWNLLVTPTRPDSDIRPTLRADGAYVFGLFTMPALKDSTEVEFRDVAVILLPHRFITIRRTDADGGRFRFEPAFERIAPTLTEPALLLWQLMDDIAERYLDLVDRIDDQVDELEDLVESDHSLETRRTIAGLRGTMLRVRRSLGPLRDATRAVLDDRVEIDGHELFPRDIEIHFAEVYDKFLRATEGLDFARDLLAGVRDYHQAQIAVDQNEVMKRLAAVAGLLLLPTFIVGLYGQNLEGSPEMGWSWGYTFSWVVIIVTTVAQFIWYRRKRWL